MICFHNPNEENGYLSNWYISNFVLNEINFSSMEQYMMYAKAKLFNDADTATKILGTDNVAKIKSLGREIKHFDEDVWTKNREQIIEQGLFAKFSQNPDLKSKLLDTGNEIIAECAVKDRIWGIGLSMQDDNRLDTFKWKGLNLLGKCLMKIRERLSVF